MLLLIPLVIISFYCCKKNNKCCWKPPPATLEPAAATVPTPSSAQVTENPNIAMTFPIKNTFGESHAVDAEVSIPPTHNPNNYQESATA